MVFKCQEDSYLKEFSSKVVSCENADFTAVIQGEKKKISGYTVILEDTVLFPEGGGQPCDQGYLDTQKVYKVLRDEDKAIHYVAYPVEVDQVVKLKVDWDRRLNHMQQHSGQHLLTAVLERDFKYNTVSWYCGEDISYVELDTPSITQEEIKKAEAICNELIRENVKVTVKTFDEKTPIEELAIYRSVRGLPADHKGAIRVVTIEGIESNMCCGTHVSNLSQLQVVKLTNSEKSKRKDKVLLYFLVGNRVINKLDKCLYREQIMTGLLKGNPENHPDLLLTVIKNLKSTNKSLQYALKELASHEAKVLKECNKKYFCIYRKHGDVDYMNSIIRELGQTYPFLFLSVGDEKGAGNIILYGEEKAVQDLGDNICGLLGGKGAARGNKYQAKVTNMSNRVEAENLIAEYFLK